MEHRHPVNQQLHDQRDFGQRAADKVGAAIGSWRFIISQTIFIVLWVTFNVLAFIHHWDPYPFILLNLSFSVQAAYAAPILQLSSNRQAQHDRLRAEADFETNQEALAGIHSIQDHLGIQRADSTP